MTFSKIWPRCAHPSFWAHYHAQQGAAPHPPAHRSFAAPLFIPWNITKWILYQRSSWEVDNVFALNLHRHGGKNISLGENPRSNKAVFLKECPTESARLICSFLMDLIRWKVLTTIIRNALLLVKDQLLLILQ